MEMQHEAAEEAIDHSVGINKTAYCVDTPKNREILELRCGDYVETVDGVEYWSTKEDDGADWRVIVPVCPLK